MISKVTRWLSTKAGPDYLTNKTSTVLRALVTFLGTPVLAPLEAR